MDKSRPISVVIADDDDAICAALGDLLRDSPGFDLVGTDRDADQAVALVSRHRPHLVLLDMRMPGGGGPQAARDIRIVSPETKIVALSANDDKVTVAGMMAAGADSYLVKGPAIEGIPETLEALIRPDTSGRR